MQSTFVPLETSAAGKNVKTKKRRDVRKERRSTGFQFQLLDEGDSQCDF
jgi:hypothetical protein